MHIYYTDTGMRALVSIQSELTSLDVHVQEENTQLLIKRILGQCHTVLWEYKGRTRKCDELKEEKKVLIVPGRSWIMMNDFLISPIYHRR